MGTVFAPNCANLSMGYHKIKLYDIIEANYHLMENSWKTEKDFKNCYTLLKTDLIKPDELLTTLNSTDNELQFSIELSGNKLPFLDICIAKTGEKIWMNIYLKLNRFYTLCFSPF